MKSQTVLYEAVEHPNGICEFVATNKARGQWMFKYVALHVIICLLYVAAQRLRAVLLFSSFIIGVYALSITFCIVVDYYTIFEERVVVVPGMCIQLYTRNLWDIEYSQLIDISRVDSIFIHEYICGSQIRCCIALESADPTRSLGSSGNSNSSASGRPQAQSQAQGGGSQGSGSTSLSVASVPVSVCSEPSQSSTPSTQSSVNAESGSPRPRSYRKSTSSPSQQAEVRTPGGHNAISVTGTGIGRLILLFRHCYPGCESLLLTYKALEAKCCCKKYT